MEKVNTSSESLAFRISDYLKVKSHTQVTGLTKFRDCVTFSLRDFLVTLVLQSAMTANEKLDVIFDLFAIDGGFPESVSIANVKVLLKTVMDRNLEHLSAAHIFSLVDLMFDPASADEVVPKDKKRELLPDN